MAKTPAWTRKEGKSPSGGLNAKGRASYNKANPGSNLKAPQPEGGPRKKSFCSRMKGMKAKLTSAKTARDPKVHCYVHVPTLVSAFHPGDRRPVRDSVQQRCCRPLKGFTP